MIKLYFLRHGQTLFNLQEKVQGHNDSPLTQKGIDEARFAGYGARDIRFSAAYSGDTQRQIDTAEAFLSLNEKPCPITADPHFREMGYGKYEGGTYLQMLSPLYEELGIPYAAYPGLYEYYDDLQIAEKLAALDETGSFEGIAKVRKRFLEGIERITSDHQEGDILISTSSFAICALVSFLFPEISVKGLVDNGSLTILSYENGNYELLSFNDISYRRKGEEYFSKRP